MKLIKKIGYGMLKLLPSELWDLSACELVDMYEAHVDSVNEEFDTEMQRTSWFTAQLMNASGNMKHAIQPEKLYKPLDKRKTKSAKEQKTYVESQREQLKNRFNIA